MEQPQLENNYSWIFFALNAKPTSMRRAIAERIAETSRVVIIERLVSVVRDRRIPSLKERYAPFLGGKASYLYRPLHFPEGLPAATILFRTLNHVLMKKELDQLLPHNEKKIICYDSPTQYPLVKRLGEDLSLYLAIDDRTLTVTGLPIKGELKAELSLLRRVDGVICVSDPLARILRSRSLQKQALPIHVLPNGYDEHLFDPDIDSHEPDPLGRIGRPRILVSGHVSERIDWEGIAEASRLRPEWHWVFVGPADPGVPEKLANVLGNRGLWHPAVASADVPAWIRYCDACAVPYRLNNFTCASSPLKATEYLAMGAPVLSTRVPSLDRYGEVILWVEENNGESYAEALDRCIAAETEEQRRQTRMQAVVNDSWAVRTDQFRRIVLNGYS